MSDCKVCAYDGDIDFSRSNTSIGDQVGCAESSVRRHRANHMDIRRVRREWEAQTPDGIQVLRSWEYLERIPSQRADLDELREVLDGFQADALDSPLTDTFVVVLADMQIGKAMELGGGTPETIERVRQSMSAIVAKARLLKPRDIYFIEGGDVIENCFSTPAQPATNDLDVPEQVRTARRLILECLKTLRPLCQTLHYVAVTSNHGEARSSMKTLVGTSESDWGLEILEQLRDVCAENESLSDIEFIRPDKFEDTVVFDTPDGTRIAVNHGHHSGSPARVKEWVKGQIVGRRPGWDADIWCLAHYHHFYVETVADGRTIIGTTTVDPGSLWFAKKTGESARPGITNFTVNAGRWGNIEVS